MDEKIITCWTGHPYLRIIDNSTDFTGKMRRLVSEITHFLGEPNAFETERRYLIRMPDLQALERLPNCRKVEIIQTYLIRQDGEPLVRVRQRGSHGSYIYVKTTVQQTADGHFLETEQRLTKDEYLSLLMDADTSLRQIRKNRYCLTENNLYFEIDVYPFWKQQALLEIQVNDPHQHIAFPPSLSILRDVTHDSAYKSYGISQHIPPEDA